MSVGTLPSPTPDHAASLLIRGGRLVGTDATPTAVAVTGGAISWVGPDEQVGTVDPATQQIDAAGALIAPAFSDAHVHLDHTGQALAGVDLSRTTSLGEALDLIREAAQARRGRAVFAHSWDELQWPEKRGPSATELDRASFGGVVFMPRVDIHSAAISSSMAALAKVHGIDGWDGQGHVERDAMHASLTAYSSVLTDSDRQEHLEVALQAAADAGIGLVHECGIPHQGPVADLSTALATGRRLGVVRVTGLWAELVDDAEQAAALCANLQVTGLAGDLSADGSFGSRTAHLNEPYTDVTVERGGPHYGHGYLSVEQIRDHAIACSIAGVQAGCHAIGDAGLGTVAAGFRAAAEVVGVERMRQCRHRWEHVELPDAEVIETMAELGIWASVQPAFDALWGGESGMYAVRLGEQRALATNPLRTLWEAGIPLALGSDTPVTPFDPWGGVAAAVLHHNEQERLPVLPAFAAHTAGGYRLAGLAGGEVAVGQLADLAIWATDSALGPEGLPDFAADPLTRPRLHTLIVGGAQVRQPE